MTKDDPADYLRSVGEAGEGPFDIAGAALMFAALDRPALSLEPYRDHLQDIATAAKSDMRLIGRVEDAGRVLAALMAGRHGYDGDRLAYDDPHNADLMAVIDRRRGLPVALGILYIHAARGAGLIASGVQSPGHFLLRIELQSEEALIDPFNGGAAVDLDRLGAPPRMAAVAMGGQVTGAVTDAEVLLRLQNNLKLRALNASDRSRALEIANRMVLVAPKRADLWIDLARLNEAAGSLGAATRSYEACLALAKRGSDLHNDAALGLYTIKRKLN